MVLAAAAQSKAGAKIAHGTSELIFLGLKKYYLYKTRCSAKKINQIVHTEFGVVHEYLPITPIFSWFTKHVRL